MIAVHGCWFDDGERALLAERGGSLAYCPGSNMFLGDGVTDLVDLVARGVRVGLGTDGGCSNNRVSVFDEMRAAALLQKVHRTDGQAIDAETCFALGTRTAGEVLRLPIGRIAPGYRCDLVGARSRRSVALARPSPRKERGLRALVSRDHRRRGRWRGSRHRAAFAACPPRRDPSPRRATSPVTGGELRPRRARATTTEIELEVSRQRTIAWAIGGTIGGSDDPRSSARSACGPATPCSRGACSARSSSR